MSFPTHRLKQPWPFLVYISHSVRNFSLISSSLLCTYARNTSSTNKRRFMKLGLNVMSVGATQPTCSLIFYQHGGRELEAILAPRILESSKCCVAKDPRKICNFFITICYCVMQNKNVAAT